jgi:hypothetical protein
MTKLEVFEKIVQGKNPFTGKALPSDDLIMHPTVQEVLSAVDWELCLFRERYYRQWFPDSTGTRWNSDEDSYLRKEFSKGTPINVLALMLQRSEAAIRDRLIRMGIKPPRRF